MQDGGFLIREVSQGSSDLELQSVGLVLVNGDGCYFTFQEMTPKWAIGKARNNWSFAWETREKGESDAAVLARITTEEVGEQVTLLTQPEFLTAFEFAGSFATFYWAQFGGATNFQSLALKNGEIKNPSWKTPLEMNSLICRVGIRHVLMKLRQEKIGQWP